MICQAEDFRMKIPSAFFVLLKIGWHSMIFITFSPAFEWLVIFNRKISL